MSVTYLIGNGFDINLGLKTKYTDFYPYFKAHASEGNMIKDWLQVDEKNKCEYERWSDLEKRLGEVTDRIETEEQLIKFGEDVINLNECLHDYMLIQQERVSVDGKDTEIQEEMKRSLISFLDYGPDEAKKLINSHISKATPGDYKYSFLNFNYTNSLDKVLEVTKKKEKGFLGHIHNQVHYDDTIDKIVHVHGTLDNGMILGVNDSTQITGKLLKNNPDIANYLIKESMNQAMFTGNINKASQIINASHLIITYGMSIGETDKYWWVKILEWLWHGDNRILIINVFDTNQRPYLLPQVAYNQRNAIIMKLKRITGNNNIDRFEKRIVVYYNQPLFNLDIVTKKED